MPSKRTKRNRGAAVPLDHMLLCVLTEGICLLAGAPFCGDDCTVDDLAGAEAAWRVHREAALTYWRQQHGDNARPCWGETMFEGDLPC